MSSDLYGELTDAGRTALEIVRRERAGDLRGVVDLISTYGDGGKALIFGAMASVVNHALAAFDELAREHGEVLRSDDLLEGEGVFTGRPAEEIAAGVLRGGLRLS